MKASKRSIKINILTTMHLTLQNVIYMDSSGKLCAQGRGVKCADFGTRHTCLLTGDLQILTPLYY